MTKIIKSTIVQAIASNIDESKGALTTRTCNQLASAMFETITQLLLIGKSVRLGKNGKLVTYLKDNKRPVRNPKTGETMILSDRWVVSFITSHRPGEGYLSVSTSSLIDYMVDFIGKEIDVVSKDSELAKSIVKNNLTTHYVCEVAVKTFIEELAKAIESFNDVEIRDFGRFKTKRVNREFVRNPRNNERIKTKSTDVFRRTSFNEGKRLKEALIEKANS